jgi:CheY-like chemotaxis protein
MSSSATLLIAEDDDNDLFFLQRAFDTAEVKNPLQIVRDGQEAIEYLSGAGSFADRIKFPLPHLFLLDLKMPRKTGMEVLEWLSEQPELRCLPVVVFSSSANRRDIERAYELGANAFVVKPSSMIERAELAKAMGLFWLESNEPPMICTDGIEAARKARAQCAES